MTIKEVEKLVTDYDAGLQANDKRFQHVVHIICDDGSSFLFDSAFIMSIDSGLKLLDGSTDLRIAVFTEHHKWHIYFEDDLIAYGQYKRIDIEELVK